MDPLLMNANTIDLDALEARPEIMFWLICEVLLGIYSGAIK